MRYANARLLAQLPTEAVTDRDLDLVDTIVQRLREVRLENGVAEHFPKHGVLIGEPYRGEQMAMRLSPTSMNAPETVQQAANFGVRVVPGQLDELTDPNKGDVPRQMMGVDFGWVPEGDPLAYEMNYDDRMMTPEYRRFLHRQQYAAQLKAALPELMAQAGMRPGDVLYNNPVGTLNGDYTRAKTYVRNGFGVPTADNEQFARIDAMGKLVPIQPFNADVGMVRSMGWTPAVTEDDIRQAQLEAAFRQQMAGEQEYFPPGY